MQAPHIKLKEIIWEITGECNNGCTYCGSKSIRTIKNSNEMILTIAKAIAQYPPEEINISGGDPFLVEPDIHEEIIHLFKTKNVVCKLIASPNSLVSNDGEIIQGTFDIIQMYDWVGISINNKKELQKFITYKEEFGFKNFKNFTIITNFNIQNLYDFELIEEYVKEQDCLWTIQFTVYKGTSPFALYSDENEGAFDFLKEKYTKSTAKIILSDNIRTDIGCGAGLSSIGITFNGIVIPCLSMRSWTKYDVVDAKVIYNITETSLKEIWENGFKKQRFGCFECCKDACKNKFLEPKKINLTEVGQISVEKKDWKKFLEEIHEKSKENPNLPNPFPEIDPNQVVMYGVASPGRVLVYGVSMPTDNVYRYGVITDSTSIQEYKCENPNSLNKIIKKTEESDNSCDEKK